MHSWRLTSKENDKLNPTFRYDITEGEACFKPPRDTKPQSNQIYNPLATGFLLSVSKTEALDFASLNALTPSKKPLESTIKGLDMARMPVYIRKSSTSFKTPSAQTEGLDMDVKPSYVYTVSLNWGALLASPPQRTNPHKRISFMEFNTQHSCHEIYRKQHRNASVNMHMSLLNNRHIHLPTNPERHMYHSTMTSILYGSTNMTSMSTSIEDHSLH